MSFLIELIDIPGTKVRIAMKELGREMPTQKDIEQLAYDLWERDGKPHGNDHHHYYEAERQLKAQPKAKKALTGYGCSSMTALNIS